MTDLERVAEALRYGARYVDVQEFTAAMADLDAHLKEDAERGELLRSRSAVITLLDRAVDSNEHLKAELTELREAVGSWALANDDYGPVWRLRRLIEEKP